MTQSQKKIAIFAPFYAPAFLGGGPIRSLSALTKTAPADYFPLVISSDTDLGQKAPLSVERNVWTVHDGVSVYYGTTKKIRFFIRALRAIRAKKPEIIYLSSFFNFKFSILPQMMATFGYFSASRVAIAPRGEFSSGALKLKNIKKSAYIWIYKLSQIGQDVLWHASSPLEAADIRRTLGPKVNVIIRANDSDLPMAATPPALSLGTALCVVFVGRIVSIKGLHILIAALRQCKVPVSLDVYGPEEDSSYALKCKLLAEDLPPNIAVRFLGATPNEEIRTALHRYDLMAFPTRGENFGHVIAEALSSSCPVMCMDVTPWTSRLLAGGGTIVKGDTTSAWASAISKFAAKSPEERLAAREAAGACFDRWRSDSQVDHLFDMLVQYYVTA